MNKAIELLRDRKIIHSIISVLMISLLVTCASIVELYVKQALLLGVLLLVSVGFLSHIFIKRIGILYVATILSTVLSIIFLYNPFSYTALLIIIFSNIFYITFGYVISYKLKSLNSKFNYTTIIIVVMFMITTIPTSKYGNLFEYSWTKAIFKTYAKEVELSLQDFYYETDTYIGSLSDKEDNVYKVVTSSDSFGLGCDSEYQYLQVKGTNNVDDQKMLLNLLNVNGFEFTSNDILVYMRNTSGVYNVDYSSNTILPIYKYSIFDAYNYEDTQIEVTLQLNRYMDKITNRDEYAQLALSIIYLLNDLNIKYDKLNIVMPQENASTITLTYSEAVNINLDVVNEKLGLTTY